MEQATSRIFYSRDDLFALGIEVADITLLRWELALRFPRRAKLGGGTLAWPKDEVDAWCRAKLAERASRQYAEY